MNYTAQLSDPSLVSADGTEVRHFTSQDAIKDAWTAAYYNTYDCAAIWGGDLPAMSTALTITVWHGTLTDVTDCYPDAEVIIGQRGRPVWRKVA